MATSALENIGQLRLAVLLVTITSAVAVVADFMLLGATQAEISLVATYGFGNVPAGKLSILDDINSVADTTSIGASFAQAICLAYLIFHATKALDHLDIEHRFSRIFAGISLFIPLVSLYVPWAALGEARQTFLTIRRTRQSATKSQRSYDAATVWLATIWVTASIASRLATKLTPTVSMETAEGWVHAMTGSRTTILVSIVIDLVQASVAILYVHRLFRLVQSVLPILTTDVFGPPVSAARVEDAPSSDTPSM